MKLSRFLSEMFLKEETAADGTRQFAEICAVNPHDAVMVEEMAIFSCINMIASIISKCEFKTYMNGKAVQGGEYYAWNYSPNKNQNAVQFIQDLVARLLLHNEVLIVDIAGQLLIADSFNREEYALKDDVFSSIACNNYSITGSFTASQVLFIKLNDANIRGAMRGLFQLYASSLAEAYDKYKSSGGKSGILKIDGIAMGNPDYESQLETLMTERFKTFFNSKNAVLPLMEGYDYIPQTTEAAKKTTNEVSDIKSLTEQALDRAANAFNIAPQLLRGDVTNIDDAIDATLTFAIDPIIKQLQVEIVRKRYGQEAVRKGAYLRIDTTRIKHVDIFDVADAADKLIAARLYNTNEIRTKIGDETIADDWADEYQQTKNYETVT